jgi:Resolvase, N terminal domain
MRDANQRKFDLVMAWSVDRLGRSLQDLVGFLSELHGILAALKAGSSVRKTAAKFGVDPSTVQRVSRPFGGASVAA